MTTLRSGSATDVGRVRQVNEDQFLEDESLFAVADGMGGAVGGEVASRLAIEALRDAFDLPRDELPSAERLVEAVEAANQAVWERARDDADLRGMGTTLTCLALVRQGAGDELAVANVGDSRAYLLSDGEFTQLTADHSLVEEMVRSGELTADQARSHPKRNIITRVLGVEPEVEVDAWLLRPVAGDRILLCSDGLSNEVDDVDMAAVLRREADPRTAADRLVALAWDHGGTDNITALVIDVVEDGEDGVLDDRAVESLLHPRGDGAGTDPGAPPSSGAGVATALATRVGADPVARVSIGDDRPPPAAPPTPPAVTPPTRRITLRVAAFLVLLAVVIAGIVAAVEWYARDSYFVGLAGRQVVIYRGRPGGFLWWHPRLIERPGLTTARVLPSRLPDLRTGMQEPSLGAARRYVRNLRQEASSLPLFRSTTTTTTASHARTGSSTTTAGGH